MIKLQIIGNLGRDAVMNTVNNKNVINFPVAHTEKYKDSTGTLKERTTWVDCAYWTDRTAILPYLKKGKLVYCEGSPEADGYLNKENKPSASLRLRVQNIQLLAGGDNPNGSHENNSQASSQGMNGGYQQQPQSQQNYGNATQASNLSSIDVADDLPF